MSVSSSEKVQVVTENGIATVTINNPGANTWDLESLPALEAVVHALNDRSDVRALIITGNGEKFFSAGADLNQFAGGDPVAAGAIAHAFGRAFEALSDYRGVSIAAINGYAMGGGLEVALACDIRIAERHASLALPEAKVGLLPCAGGTQRLAQLVGEGWAKRMILCGERLAADKALSVGLVEEVVESGEALSTAIALAISASGQSPTSIAACKRLIHSARDVSIGAGLIAERDEFVALFSTEDQKEGVNAFLEKRAPEWKNK
ncbi:MAG: enoyl-CoA hydratase [Luminiphilus sp.]|nr:enoyl-CoA hydratase [Luminiphilus sp.]MDG1507827.1 enoyl-CoA hydratase [Luminiphilus sp.]